jgi:hypothetical protein
MYTQRRRRPPERTSFEVRAKLLFEATIRPLIRPAYRVEVFESGGKAWGRLVTGRAA